MACTHKVKLESKFINASLAVEIMEGIATKLYPAMIVQDIALPLVLKAEITHGLRKGEAEAKAWVPKIFGGRGGEEKKE